MSQQAKELILQQFVRALRALDEAIVTDSGDKKSRDSILLSYVFTFEMAVKSLKVTLAELGLDVPNYASAILKGAFQARLIDDAGSWEALRDRRNLVNHAYDEVKAVEIAAYVRQHALSHFGQLLKVLQT